MLLTEIPVVDGVLHAHAAELGDDFAGYRNHVYRVLNLCVALTSVNAEQLRRLFVATAFHDLGIWTNRTFDYLEPSAGRTGSTSRTGPSRSDCRARSCARFSLRGRMPAFS